LPAMVNYTIDAEADPNKMVVYLERERRDVRTIVIDAGHGGQDPGAPGFNGLQEKEVNLDIAIRLRNLLAKFKVILTRVEDVYVSLGDRVAIANENNADIFVAIHCNSCGIPDSRSGIETYYATSQSVALAQAVHQSLVQGLGLKDGGVRQKTAFFIRNARMPAILVECAYINNSIEGALLAEPEFRQKVAQAIFNGIKQYEYAYGHAENIPVEGGTR